MSSRLYSRTFITMFTAQLCTMSSMAAFFLFPLYIIDHGGSKTDVGVLMGAMALSSVLCRPWISEMVDRFGRKRSYAVGCAVMAVTPLAYFLVQGDVDTFYFPLLAIRVVHGVGVAICFTAAFTYIADIVPENRLNEGIGMFGSAGLLGMALGPIIAEAVTGMFGFRALFLTGSVLGGLSLVLQWPLKESFSGTRNEAPVSFFKVLARGRIAILALLALLFGVGLAAYGNFVSPYCRVLGLPLVSVYYIAYSAAAVMTRLFGGRLADRVGEERIAPYAMVMTGVGLAMLAVLNGNALLVVSGLVTGVGHGFLFPCLNALAIRREPISIRGKINGIFTGGMDTGMLVGSIGLGFIGDFVGFPAIFLTAGLSLLAGVPVFRAVDWRRAEPR